LRVVWDLFVRRGTFSFAHLWPVNTNSTIMGWLGWGTPHKGRASLPGQALEHARLTWLQISFLVCGMLHACEVIVGLPNTRAHKGTAKLSQKCWIRFSVVLHHCKVRLALQCVCSVP
jgi:hypothetical protein